MATAQGPSTSTVLDTIWNSSRAHRRHHRTAFPGQNEPVGLTQPRLCFNLRVKTARGQECVAVPCLLTLTSQVAWDYLQQQCGQCKGMLGTWALTLHLQELQFTELVRNAEYCNPTKLIRRVLYQHDSLLFKVTKVTHASHGHLIPDALFARYLTTDQECSAPADGCFGLRFIYSLTIK